MHRRTGEGTTASDRILEELHVVPHDQFDIDHTTIQIESERLVQIVSPATTEARALRSQEGGYR